MFANSLGGLCGQFDRINSDGVGRWADAASYIVGPGSPGWDIRSVNKSVGWYGRTEVFNLLLGAIGTSFGVSRAILLLKADKSLDITITVP